MMTEEQKRVRIFYRPSNQKKKMKLHDALQKNIAGTGGHMAEVTVVAEDGSARGLAGMKTRPPLPPLRRLGQEGNLSQV